MAEHATKPTLPPQYDPKAVEAGRYRWWVENKFFEAGGDPNKKPYSIVIPPPNVTGNLHLGHALNCTLQDILIRMKRMQGYDACGCRAWTMPASPRRRVSRRSLPRRG